MSFSDPVHRILSRDLLAPGIVRFLVDAPLVARKCRPGQFVIVRLHDRGERIPLTIHDSDRPAGTITLVVQAVGKTTTELNALGAGDRILDVAGPLGQPTRITPDTRVCCIAGGIGAAVVLPVARAFHEAGGEVTTILGARTRELVILESELRAISRSCIITTDDGSHGRRGFVTDALRDLIGPGPAPFDEIVAVGPLPMMRAVCEVTRPFGVRTTVSLNPVMVDGTGMCGGCRVTVGGEQRFVCTDGPEFDGHLVDFEQLNARLSAFREQEAIAAERFRTACQSEAAS
jgi:ferredoxin--NADP+ reductase